MIRVILTPSRNEMRFEHIGCDTPTPWIVPLDDCMAPAVGSIEECARCCMLVRIGGVELTEDFDWGGVNVQPAHKAQRGSNVEAYIKRARDRFHPEESVTGFHRHAHAVLDALLDDYRERADTGRNLADDT